MAWKHADWETTLPDEGSGVPLLRLCGNPDPDHPDEDWPRVAVLDLSDEEFRVFDDNPFKYSRVHNLFPEQPILWMSDCVKPPVGKGIPQAAPGTRWTVIINHARVSMATCAATPQKFVAPPKGDDSELA
jgi:hypothetical protein